jgi:SAM-dependent methyltransferase
MSDVKVSANAYRSRAFGVMRALLSQQSFDRALDFGAGDGWFASTMSSSRVAREIVAVDVMLRPGCHFPVTVYDGIRLPFADSEFPLVYAVDVIHHCKDPEAALRDILRVCGRYFLIKDHNYSTQLGRFTLAVLDELGNRRFGVPSLYQYQRDFNWSTIIESAGFRVAKMVHPVAVHTGILGAATNKLQYVALFERQ